MREWAHLVADDPATWRALAAEALDFVAASTPDRQRR
jgi:hypothetical protein